MALPQSLPMFYSKVKFIENYNLSFNKSIKIPQIDVFYK